MEKLARPEVLGGICVKKVTACGNMYVQMSWCKGRLFEVFATLGHSGGCASSQTEAITRSVTLGLRTGAPPAEYAKQLRGIRCPSPTLFPKDKETLSCSDAIGRAVEQYGELDLDGLLELIRRVSGSAGSTLHLDKEQGTTADEEEQRAAMAEIAKLAEERRRQGVRD